MSLRVKPPFVKIKSEFMVGRVSDFRFVMNANEGCFVKADI